MTRPIGEFSPGRQASGHGYSIRQLMRRPIPHHVVGVLPFAYVKYFNLLTPYVIPDSTPVTFDEIFDDDVTMITGRYDQEAFTIFDVDGARGSIFPSFGNVSGVYICTITVAFDSDVSGLKILQQSWPGGQVPSGSPFEFNETGSIWTTTEHHSIGGEGGDWSGSIYQESGGDAFLTTAAIEVTQFLDALGWATLTEWGPLTPSS